MARTANTKLAVNAVFYVGHTELAEQLAVFCSIKKLAWSPDNKVAMTKMPATSLEDAAHLLLKGQTHGALQGILADLLKPIKEHDLFDLSDWLRDLDGVPDYLKTHWTDNRVPTLLDDLMKRALGNGVGGPGATLDPEWPLPPKVKAKAQTAPIPQVKQKVLTGPKGRGKVAKDDPFVGALDSQADVFVDAALQCLKDKKMCQLASKTVWTRVHKAVEALMNASDLSLSPSTRPQRVETEDPKQALVTYYVADATAAGDYQGFKADLLTEFDGFIVDVQAVNDEEVPRSFKVWFKHA